MFLCSSPYSGYKEKSKGLLISLTLTIHLPDLSFVFPTFKVTAKEAPVSTLPYNVSPRLYVTRQVVMLMMIVSFRHDTHLFSV